MARRKKNILTFVARRQEKVNPYFMEEVEVLKACAAAFAIGVGTIFPASAIGRLAAKAMEAIGRNPEAASKIQGPMILAIAFAEAIAIYALVVALVIKFT